jgi:hypothetical protein
MLIGFSFQETAIFVKLNLLEYENLIVISIPFGLHTLHFKSSISGFCLKANP